MNGKFNFQGKMFYTQEEMFEYAKKWQSKLLDEQSANVMLEKLKKDIIKNFFLRGLEYTNEDFNEYVEEVFKFAMNKLVKFKKKVLKQ